jgi:hypothetical protein
MEIVFVPSESILLATTCVSRGFPLFLPRVIAVRSSLVSKVSALYPLPPNFAYPSGSFAVSAVEKEICHVLKSSVNLFPCTPEKSVLRE